MGFAEFLAMGDAIVRSKLGGTVTYSPGSGSDVEVVGIFDAAYVRVDAADAGIASTGPAVFLTLEDLPSNPVVDLNATVIVDGVEYTPHERRPDGLGGVYLLLHKV
jgi:hypothetical protein